MKFEELNLNPDLLRGIADKGFTELTPVQEQTLSVTLKGGDAAVQSQTGTGKTAAFLITLFERLWSHRGSPRNHALVIAPTRELALQIEGEARVLGGHLPFRVACIFGGVGYGLQEAQLREGVDIAIGTPGRLIDFTEQGKLKLKETGFLVIDEADRLFDMGFLPDLRRILDRLPPPGKRQSMLFSATLSRLARRLAMDYLHDAEFIEVTPEHVTVDTVSQELYHVKSHIKPNLLLGILKKHQPHNALIFVNTRHEAFRLAKRLEANGYRSRHLTGDLSQADRLRVMKDFASGKIPFLVATDVAARGLHIEGLEMVINYDLPEDFENYVHRIGRTARAGQTGKAISLASEGTDEHLRAIEKFIGEHIPVQTADMSMYLTDTSLEHPGRLEQPGRRGGRDHRSSSRRGGSRRPGGGGSRGGPRPASGGPGR
jgi:ATP-dependent RNA helicase RhlB